MTKNKLIYKKIWTPYRREWQLWLILILPLAYLIIFRYIPMWGLLMSFQDYRPSRGFWGSDWVGIKHFAAFISSYQFWRVLRNTVMLSLLTITLGFPAPIILALLVHNCNIRWLRKSTQMVTYLPYFISMVVFVAMINQVIDNRIGIVTMLLRSMGFTAENIQGNPAAFPWIYILSGIWQTAGYGAIIYIAALANVSPDLHESAVMDGANRWQRIWHIDIPSIMPTIIILFVLSLGQVMNVGFEKVFLMQNGINLKYSEIIATLVYKRGLINANFSFATSVGFFNSVINFTLLFSINRIVRKFSENSLW